MGAYSKRVFEIRLHLKSSKFVVDTIHGERPGFTFEHFIRSVEELARWYPNNAYGLSVPVLRQYLKRLQVLGFIVELSKEERSILIKGEYKKRDKLYRFTDEPWGVVTEIPREFMTVQCEVEPELPVFQAQNIIKEERRNVVKWK